MTDPRTPGDEEDRGRDDYHDPTASWAGAPPARSALTLRLVLAVFGVIACCAVAVVLAAAGAATGAVVVFALLALVALVDAVVVARRKLRGEPG